MGHEALCYIIYIITLHTCVENSLCTQWRPTPFGQPCDHLEEEILAEHGHMLLLMHAL